MIVERIKRHNVVNGFLFSFIEFGLVAILIGGFAIYAFIRRDDLIGIAGIGIAANSFPIMLYSLRSLKTGEESIGFKSWLHSSGRSLIATRYPETSTDTTVIVITAVIPFLAMTLTLIDILMHPRTHSKLS